MKIIQLPNRRFKTCEAAMEYACAYDNINKTDPKTHVQYELLQVRKVCTNRSQVAREVWYEMRATYTAL